MGEIRYKKKGEDQWSSPIKVSELPDGSLKLEGRGDYDINWTLAARRNEIKTLNEKENEVIFFSLGEQYILDEENVKKLLNIMGIQEKLEDDQIYLQLELADELEGDRECFEQSDQIWEWNPLLKAENTIVFANENNGETVYYCAQLLGEKGEVNWYREDEKAYNSAKIKIKVNVGSE